MPDKEQRKHKPSQGKQLVGGSIDASGVKGNRSSRNGVYFFSSAIFIVVAALIIGIAYGNDLLNVWIIFAAVVLAVFCAASIRIAQQWEKAVVLRLGKFNRVAGPGLYLVIPVIEHVTICIDQRIMTTPFVAEETLTADLVSVDVDAVLFWMVWDARMACVEVENYPKAVAWSAQTALRDAIGRVNLAELATRRKQIDGQLQETLTAKTEPWGITIISVEIRAIIIPAELQDALSKEAQAERERNARVILAEVEKDISEMFVEAAEIYDRNDRAMQLRTMNLIYESVREHGGLVIAPSAFAEGFNNIEGVPDLLKKLGT
jgi:regulator of protease activity HflC (stomatin/prohibitin superfamily)